MSAKFSTNALATELVNEAERAALREMGHQSSTRQVLDALAARIRDMVLAQVLLGRWAPLGVHDTDELYQLRVTTELERLPKLKLHINYDFSRTKLQMLIVDREAVRGKA